MCFYIEKPQNISLIVGPTHEKTHLLTFPLYSFMLQLINLKILLWSLDNGEK